MDIRVGSGFDVHGIKEGAGIVLFGVHVDCDFSLLGHSDADVGLHAIVDALLGAICEEDIGYHFSWKDPQWKNADSSHFLDFAAEKVRLRRGRINHVDATLIGELPKLSPYRQAMRERVAKILQIDISRVSIKATTTEKLGFCGRGEGLAVLATATVILPSDGY
jgi:2-C-methyl-D-erythritol 2,4-cyclodiphosphate synthase